MEVVELIAAQQGEHSYPVHVGPGAALSLPPLLEGVDRVALVSCRKVLSTRFGEAVAARVEATTPLAVKHVLADGEKGKTLAELERAAVALLEAGCTRRSLVIALGGGAVTDAGGFLAATFMRGIPWIAVPTTLLAMVDASIGGKTGANLPVAKNAVGAFHPPRAVLSDPSALTTLPSREMRSGMGEVLKYGALNPALLSPFAAACAGTVMDPSVIATCARMKVDVVAEDPTERGPRKLLNLGHTFGHGVEAAGRFSRLHPWRGGCDRHGLRLQVGPQAGPGGGDRGGPSGAALDEAGLPTRVPGVVASQAVRLMAFDKSEPLQGFAGCCPGRAGLPGSWSGMWRRSPRRYRIQCKRFPCRSGPQDRRGARPRGGNDDTARKWPQPEPAR